MTECKADEHHTTRSEIHVNRLETYTGDRRPRYKNHNLTLSQLWWQNWYGLGAHDFLQPATLYGDNYPCPGNLHKDIAPESSFRNVAVFGDSPQDKMQRRTRTKK